MHRVPECARKTKELLDDRCSRMESKRKKLLRSQTKERSCALQPKPTRDPCDPERLAEVGEHRRLHLRPLLRNNHRPL